MKKNWLMVLLVLGWGIFSVGAEPVPVDVEAGFESDETAAAEEDAAGATPESYQAPVKTPMLPVALVAYGDVDDALTARAHQWAEYNLAMPVFLRPAQPATQLGSFDEVAELAEASLESNRLGIVVLWRPNSDVKNHGAFFPDRRVSIVNLNAMFTEDTDAEVIERRVERQVIRGICFVMGLEPNPNPHSAMFAYTSLEELDAIGRNLDPPWLVRLQEKALSVGIPIDLENPFNLVTPR